MTTKFAYVKVRHDPCRPKACIICGADETGLSGTLDLIVDFSGCS